MLTLSKDHNSNYLATIWKIDKVFPIENADKLVKTVINGYDMVISKDMQPGDIVVYFPVESAISEKFLSVNNLYELHEAHRNANYPEVEKFLQVEDNDSAKALCGFFNKHGRVRIIKLRGQYSMGFVAGIDKLIKVFPELNNFDFNTVINTQFDTCCGELLVKKYVPVTQQSSSNIKPRKQNKGFDKLIPGQFEFHYDTKMLAEHIKEIVPETNVTLTVKVHGTSVILSNILCKRKLSFWEKIKKFFGCNVQTTEYSNIYSSRKVIKNQFINPSTKHYYSTDVWGCVNKVFAPYIDKGMTVYGEIVGYEEGSPCYIQKNHDYGCKSGEWKFMPYRITTTENNSKFEWNVLEVRDWTLRLIKEHPELESKILLLNVLYHGRLQDIYKDIPVDNDFHFNLLEKMKSDDTFLLMEKNEPMCKNKVPREGIVLRIDNDIFARAWKLKSKAHYNLEAKSHDAGEANIEEIS